MRHSESSVLCRGHRQASSDGLDGISATMVATEDEPTGTRR